MRAHLHSHIWTQAYTHTLTYTHARVRSSTPHTRMHAHAHACTHTHTHTHTHTNTTHPTWSTRMWAPLPDCRLRMVSPPRPMMRPTMPGGHCTWRVDSTPPEGRLPVSLFKTSFTKPLHTSTPEAFPIRCTGFNSLSALWSTCTRTPVRPSSSLMVTPALPMMRPTWGEGEGARKAV